jgi:ribonuclease I
MGKPLAGMTSTPRWLRLWKTERQGFKLTCNGNPAYLTEMQISIKAATINAPSPLIHSYPSPIRELR